jgi:RHS repeat-associated protein
MRGPVAGWTSRTTFDAQDRLKTAVTPEGTTTYGYFADGLAKTTAYFNGLHEGRCYDDAGRLTGLVTARAAIANACLPGGFVSRQRYTHDAEGNRLTQVEELTPAGGNAPSSAEVTEYGYDDESRLVGVRYPDNTAALYQLDAVGNRVGERKAASSMVPALTVAAFLAMSPGALTNDAVAVFNRADWLEAVTDSRAPAKDATFEWDVAGNLKRQQTAWRDRRFTWDVKQTLTKVEDNGIEAGRYDYGADGLRSKRITSLESVEYVLDGMQVLVEADGSNSAHPAKRRYTYGSSALAVTDISGSTRVTKALHLDALGSPAIETSQSGAVAAVRQYDAWGQYRNGTAPGSTDMKLGYTGHQYDVETGLVYARARYYDADYGRFLPRDSVEGALVSAPTLHRFAYVQGNPLRYSDPSGNCPNCLAAGIGAGIGFALGFGAALLDGKSVGDAALVGLGGAAFGGLTGLTMGASLAGGATAWAATTALAGKLAVGAALDIGRQRLVQQVNPDKKFSYSELAIATLAGGGAPTGGQVAQLPNLARTYAAAGVVFGSAGVAVGSVEVKEAVEMRNGNLALLGIFDIATGGAGIKGGAQGLRALEGVFAPQARTQQVSTSRSEELLGAGSDLDAHIAMATERIPGLTKEQARIILEGAYKNDSTAVFGGSRVRGNYKPESDLDVGYGSMTENQAVKLNKRATKVGPLTLEKLQIVPGKQTQYIEEITTPEEFFQRSGTRAPTDPGGPGEPYEGSGSYTFEPGGSVVYTPPQSASPPMSLPAPDSTPGPVGPLLCGTLGTCD